MRQVGHCGDCISLPVIFVEPQGVAEHAHVVTDDVPGDMERTSVQQVSVSQMAAVGNRCRIFPRFRHEVVHVRGCVEIQSQGAVAALGVVARKSVGVQDYWRAGRVDFQRGDDCVVADSLHVGCIDPCQGVDACWIYKLVMFCIEASPLGRRVAAGVIVKLGLRTYRQASDGCQEQQYRGDFSHL